MSKKFNPKVPSSPEELQKFIADYNKKVRNMPLDYAVCQEFLKIIYATLAQSPRRDLFHKLFHRVLVELESNANAMNFSRSLSSIQLHEVISEEDFVKYYYLTYMPDEVPIEEVERKVSERGGVE